MLRLGSIAYFLATDLLSRVKGKDRDLKKYIGQYLFIRGLPNGPCKNEPT